jgi:hypothetical protein
MMDLYILFGFSPFHGITFFKGIIFSVPAQCCMTLPVTIDAEEPGESLLTDRMAWLC